MFTAKLLNTTSPLQAKISHARLTLAFLNSVSPLCPYRFVVQLARSFGVWDFFYFFYFTIAFAFEQQKKASAATAPQEGKGFLSAKHSHIYSSSTTAEGLAFKINPNLAHQSCRLCTTFT